MTLHTYDDVEQRSDEWFQLRLGMVTASVVGQLVTAKTLKPADNDYSRALTAKLAAERITGWSEPSYMNADMIRGVEHEPFARDAYAQHHAPVDECGLMVREEATWKLGLSPDGLVGKDGLLEIKCPRAKAHLATILDDAAPAQYVPQLQAALLVSGRQWVDFVSFVGGMPLYVKRVTPDLRWFNAIIAAVELFEENAAEMVGLYEQATEGLPMTERPLLLDEMVI